MSLPPGLRHPIDLAQLILPVLIFIGVCAAVFFAIRDLFQMGWPGLP